MYEESKCEHGSLMMTTQLKPDDDTETQLICACCMSTYIPTQAGSLHCPTCAAGVIVNPIPETPLTQQPSKSQPTVTQAAKTLPARPTLVLTKPFKRPK